MLTNCDPISFIATLDAENSLAFYQKTLGLNLVADDEFAIVFDLSGHTLRIAKVDELVRKRISSSQTLLRLQVER